MNIVVSTFSGFLTRNLLFQQEALTANLMPMIERCLGLAIDIFSSCKQSLPLSDIQHFVHVVCYYFGNPRTTFRMVRRLIDVLIEIAHLARQSIGNNKDMICKMMIDLLIY